MIQIPLTRGLVAVVDDEYAHLASMRWYAKVTKWGTYAVRRVRTPTGKRNIYLHREVFGGDGALVDHKDGDTLNCRRDNLRAATPAQNSRNQRKRKDNQSGVKGVSFIRDARKLNKPWRARIRVNGKARYLGYFATAQEAAEAYDRAAKELHGEFAKTNEDESC